MNCKRCGKKLENKQIRWCSPRCSKLGLKAIYKKRNRIKVAQYNRNYRKTKKNDIKISYQHYCYFCNARVNIEKHHLSYEPEIMISLCFSCHRKIHALMKMDARYAKL